LTGLLSAARNAYFNFEVEKAKGSILYTEVYGGAILIV
jgi:hypothetical protein